MNILKPTDEIKVFDNLYCKPSQLGVPGNERHSMVVLFSVNHVIYYGQYDFTTGLWITIPGDEHKREFEDRVVQYWFYPPGTSKVLKAYAWHVHQGEARSNISRVDEFVDDAEGVQDKL